MSLYKSIKADSPPLSQNKIVEQFTRCHPLVPFILFIPVVVFFSYRAFAIVRNPWWEVAGLWMTALIFWTVLEYVLHRFVLHHRPQSEWAKKIFYAIHWVHHDYPDDKTRVVVAPWVSIPGAFIFYGMFRLLLGAGYIDAYFSGLVACYLIYDLNHYAVHHFHWRNKWFQIIQKHHMRHHFKHPDKDFGFTTTLWDKLFKTEE